MTRLFMGEVREVKRCSTTVCEFEWSIPEFASLLTEDDKYYSRHFEVLGDLCFLVINLNHLESSTSSTTQKDTVGYFDIGLRMEYSQKTPTVMEVSFAIRNADGTKDQERHDPYQTLISHSLYYDVDCYISRAELLERASELMPSNIFTVVCSVRYPESIDGKSTSENSECTHCAGILDAKAISFHEKNCCDKLVKCPECSEVVVLGHWSEHECQLRKKADKTGFARCIHCQELVEAKTILLHEKKCLIKCPDCLEVVALKNWQDHECHTAKSEDDEYLNQDLKKMLLEGDNHDLIIKIGDKELRAHKDILSCRSRVFESMMKHDMEEKNSGVINVPDCDPQAMEVFLSYVYTGKVETLHQSNMLGLYYIADKYDMQRLKKVSADYIKKSLSITNICDVIQLALKHSDSSLLECAKEYFMNNVLDIMRTVEWQIFLKDNTTVGNELLMKAFEKLKT